MLTGFLCQILLFSLSRLAWPVWAQDEAPQIELAGKSYAITAKLLVSYPWRANDLYEIQEVYSAWQKRSRVKYRTISRAHKTDQTYTFPEEAQFYSDEKQVLMLTSGDERSCSQSTREFTDKLFNLNWLKSDDGSPIIGPSKFLHFAHQNRKNVLTNNATTEVLARRPGFIRYDFEIPDRNTIYSLYYHEDGARNLLHGIPAKLSATIRGSSEYVFTYKFKRIDLLPQGPAYGTADSIVRQYSMDTEPVALDSLAIQPAVGCARAAVRPLDDEARNELLKTNFRFSFRARAELQQMFVGYEPSISTLRVERVGQTRATETITNFFTYLSYHVVRRVAQKDYVLDNLLNVRDNDALQNDLSCVVTKAPSSELALGSSYTLGRMLFGTNDFAYLGLARVRGIEARVFEVFNSSWPVWFQLPISYHTTSDWINISNEIKTRQPLDRSADVILNSVVYMSHTANERNPFDGQLLLIEVYKLDAATLRMLSKKSIPVHEFSWRLNGNSPRGVSSEQFYSLGDSCASASAEDNHYGQVELLLQRNWPVDEAPGQTSDWLGEPTRRNFALMKATQEMCALPASMIYDIESTLKTSTGGPASARQATVSVAVQLRVVEHTRSLVQLIYIGRGEMKRDQRANFRSFYAASFQACYFIAAHKKVNTLFAFDSAQIKCFMFKGAIVGTFKMSIQSNFDMDHASRPERRGTLEVYRIRQLANSRPEDELTLLASSENRFNRLRKVALADPGNANATQLEIELKSIRVNELNQKNPYQLDELQFADSNKFLGFGLVAADKQSRQIQANYLRTDDWLVRGESAAKFDHLLSDMTFGQCQAACTADLECRSYSVCIRNSRLECTLSSVSFRSPVLILQMLQIQDGRMRFNQEYELSPDDGAPKVHIKRHPGCELHNKLYIDLFHRTNHKPSVNLLRRPLRPVKDREQCAMLCMNATMSVLRGDIETLRQASWSTLGEPERNVDSVRDMFNKYKRAHGEICSAFFYVDKVDQLLLPADERRLLEAQIVGKNANEITDGYCIFGESLTKEAAGRAAAKARAQALRRGVGEEEPDQTPPPTKTVAGDETGANSKLELGAEEYNFDFAHMFERQHGLSLVASKMDNSTNKAYQQITARAGKLEVSSGEFESLKLFLDKGENVGIGYSIVTDEEHCARACFLQLLQMWPGCRSFDVLEVSALSSRELHCYFNSVSLSDALRAERFDLVREKPGDQARLPTKIVTRVTHFEPKRHFVAGSLSLASQLMLDESYADDVYPNISHKLKLGYFGLVATITLALVAGTVSGLELGARLQRNPPETRETRDDVERLVEPATIEFSNLVNFEGLIVEDSRRPDERPNGDASAKQATSGSPSESGLTG